MGNPAQLTSDVVFDKVFVPDDHVTGAENGGLRVALGALALGRMGIGAIGVAMAQAAFDHAVEGNAEVEAAMAKLTGSRLAVDVAHDAIQVCGAYGFVRELSATSELMPLESIYRDAKIGEIYERANEIQKWVIARNIFGRIYTG
ncbi:acyl-CoA dehydrogenase family protein [Paraburkholderia ferrariae]|uniref:acyl-CoA dehydrogenase family protein n=1 Tax=Paraburkholderia ferrariae TaxID=386056 RepID=UPI001FDEF0AE|nr:acyl-CoA dehydrogenase family protein [Paraburkholderia ferrariae]